MGAATGSDERQQCTVSAKNRRSMRLPATVRIAARDLWQKLPCQKLSAFSFNLAIQLYRALNGELSEIEY